VTTAQRTRLQFPAPTPSFRALVATQTSPADSAPEAAPKAAQGNYEEIVARLAQVVERLEGGGLTLEDSISAFEEGIRLARHGSQKLEEAEKKVELLLENDRTQPFASGRGASPDGDEPDAKRR
jgi:exodeoxyribonuclease VII small subunit